MTRSDTPESGRTCGHAHHVGTCASCQRAQLARWRTQLIQAQVKQPARLQ
ncbi:MAG: hypothetical protein M3076_20505 [Actinomycetota bacterium]|nr:hypothetical protein [Actinomycetota bacterium]